MTHEDKMTSETMSSSGETDTPRCVGCGTPLTNGYSVDFPGQVPLGDGATAIAICPTCAEVMILDQGKARPISHSEVDAISADGETMARLGKISEQLAAGRSMRLDETQEFEGRTGARLDAAFLAFPHPVEINRVFLVGHHRLRIVREVTREQFKALQAENRRSGAYASGTARLNNNSRFVPDGAKETGEIPEEVSYFYVAEPVGEGEPEA